MSIQYSVDFGLCQKIMYSLLCSSEHNPNDYSPVTFQIYFSSLSVDSKNRCWIHVTFQFNHLIPHSVKNAIADGILKNRANFRWEHHSPEKWSRLAEPWQIRARVAGAWVQASVPPPPLAPEESDTECSVIPLIVSPMSADLLSSHFCGRATWSTKRLLFYPSKEWNHYPTHKVWLVHQCR